MIILAADTQRDQEMLDKFQRAYENLKKIVDKQNRKIKDLEDQLEEYKKRHPSSVGVKNGKTYDIAVSGNAQPEDIHEIQEKRKPGAQIGHKGYFRIKVWHIRLNSYVVIKIKKFAHCISEANR